MTLTATAPVEPLWVAAAASFSPHNAQTRVKRLLHHAPAATIIAAQIVLTLRLHNLANPDEALYIDAGHRYFTQWAGGAAAPNYGSFFSGFPYAYPVLAAAIDHVGGLELVRFTSLLMMLGATLCVRMIAESLAGSVHARAAGLTAMTFCACAAPTLFVGHFATFDAACSSLAILAATLAIRGHGLLSAVCSGFAISAAAIFKYAGGAFIPVVILLALISAPSLRHGVVRALVILLTAAPCIVDLLALERNFILDGIEFTTSNRTVESYRSYGFLIRQFSLGAGVLTVVALTAIIVSWRYMRSSRLLLTQLVLVLAGLAIPTSQLHIPEYTSFNKHLVFLTVFASPVAGQIAVGVRKRFARFIVLIPVLYLVLVLAIVRSDFMFQEWPNPSPVIAAVNQRDVPGAYIGVGADEIGYYERGHAQFSWQEPFALYGSGPNAIRQAISRGTYAGVFYTSGGSGSDALDQSTALIASLLAADPHYRLVGTWPKHKYDQDKWFLWVKVSNP